MRFLALLICTAGLAANAFCQHPPTPIDSLGWLAGCWEGAYGNGRIVSEQWMKPSGGVMMSMARTVRNGKVLEHEFVLLEQLEDGSIYYRAHPSGQPGGSFALVALEGGKAVFENLRHDYPQRIIYRLISPDSLAARVEGMVNGKVKGSDFPYRRAKCE